MRANALVVFPGGFGTLDELFELLTLMQTNKMHRIPVVMMDREYWSQVINFGICARGNDRPRGSGAVFICR